MKVMKARHQVEEYLMDKGFAYTEARTIGKGYSMANVRHLPYLQRLISARRLLVFNYRKRGLTEREITRRIHGLYKRKDWTKDDKRDVWTMIRDYRDEAIKDGDYFPVKRKGISHHSVAEGIKREQIKEQRQRAGNAPKLRTRLAAIEKEMHGKKQMPVDAYERLEREHKYISQQLMEG